MSRTSTSVGPGFRSLNRFSNRQTRLVERNQLWSVNQCRCFEPTRGSLSEQSRNCSGLVNAESRGLYLGFLVNYRLSQCVSSCRVRAQDRSFPVPHPRQNNQISLTLSVNGHRLVNRTHKPEIRTRCTRYRASSDPTSRDKELC